MRTESALLSLFLFLFSVVAHGQTTTASNKFSPQQIDHILVLDRLNNRDEDTRRLAAVAYTVHNAQMLLTSQANRETLLQATTPSEIYDKDTQIIIAGPNGSI